MKKYIPRILAAIAALAVLGALAGLYIFRAVGIVGARGEVSADGAAAADCIIVPGAGVIGGRPSLTLARRLDKALEVYEKSGTPRIIVSGDHGRRDYDEVNVMRDYLVARGVPVENIFMDHAGFSTYETLYRARDIFCAERVIIVTQKLHLDRALYIADALGLSAVGVRADESTVRSRRVQTIREVPARVKAFIECRTKPRPTYLGEKIPVSGVGTVTEG